MVSRRLVHAAVVGSESPATVKVARLHGQHFATRRAAMDEIVDWLGFYNSRRLHSTLDYVSPMTFEQNWFAAQQGRAA
jgi:putative transposase